MKYNIDINNNYNNFELSINSLKGFINLGNTCYMNSSLQCLIHCNVFTKNILPLKNKHNIITKAVIDICENIMH